MSIEERAFNAAASGKGMRMKELMKKLVRHTGYTISGNPTFEAFLRSRGVTLVLDVGANTGQFASALREGGYHGDIISFEPVKSVYRDLTERMRGDKRWAGRNIALGATRSAGSINVSEATVFSSILTQAPYAKVFDPATRVTRTEMVEIHPLDDVIEGCGSHSNIFCKIHAQGSEEAILGGARKSLHRFCGLHLLLPIQQLYEGRWPLSDALAKLDNLGFVPAQMRPTSFMTGDAVCWTEVEITFRKK
jgi:FkbM family methyltransferase